MSEPIVAGAIVATPINSAKENEFASAAHFFSAVRALARVELGSEVMA